MNSSTEKFLGSIANRFGIVVGRGRGLSRRLLGLMLSGVLITSYVVVAGPSGAYAAGSLTLHETIQGASSYRLASNPALSGDGTTIIYGQPGHWAGWATRHRATVEVRKWNGSAWVAKGSLPDSANREIGFWHDISDDGDVVSHSSHVLDRVFVYDWSGTSWVPRPVVTASQSAVSIVKHSLSGDGAVLVVGERGYDNGEEINNGKVRTLDWDGSSWSERTDIIGAEGEKLGDSRMDITSDGLTISFGGSRHSTAGKVEAGTVRVSTWDGTSWTERPSLTGSQASARAANPALSDDGAVLGFSEGQFRVSGRIRTFDWDGSSWAERPISADGSTAWVDLDMSASGSSISMSDNDTQKVRVYDWAGDSWVQRGSDVPSFSTGGGAHYGNVASLSSDGLLVATSQVYSDINGSRSGRIDIYSSPSAQRGVQFAANSGSGSMATLVSTGSASLDANTFTQTGYTFAGWNTASDGTGTSYSDGATYAFSANVTLYAQWIGPPTVTFDANEGAGSMSAQSGSSSASLTSNTFTRTGYTFAGWNSAADGTGTTYAEGATYDFSANLTLYAQWSVVVAAPASGGEASEPAAKPVAPARAPLVVVPRRVVELGARVAPVALPRDAQGAKSSQPVALVGGEEVVVKSEAKGPQAARFGAGKFVLDMGVEDSDGTVESVAGMPSVKIGRGGSAAVKGSGLQPSSRMQVFLPAADGSFIELPPVLVGPDGSFDAAVTFGTPERQRPLPIGKQFIQMFGVDEDGNQTVLEIPVTISQPLPVPEINRVSGERPVLSPGQSVAFNAGTPETVSLSRVDETLSVVGEGWSFTVTDSASNGTAENLAFTRDTPMVFAGAGFMPGTRADVWLFSEPTLMGTVDIAADGTFEASFAVDSNFVPTGDHTLQIQGVGDDGFVRAANLGVVVGDLADTPLVPPGVDPFSWLPLLLVATALGGIVTLVGVMVAMSRRRRLVGRLLPVG